MVFASLLFHASMILSGLGPKILAYPPHLLASSDVSFPVPIALVSEDADELVAWRNATPVADHPSRCMLLVAEKPFGKHANLVLPFVNVTPASDVYSPAVGCFSGDGSSVEMDGRAALVQFALTGILARAFFAFRLVASCVEDVLVGSTCFLDVVVAALTSKRVEMAAAVFPFWGLVPLLFRHLTFTLFIFLSAIIPYRMIVKGYHSCIVARPRAPVYDGVHFACVEGSATTSVYECPRLFQTLEEKALLYYSSDDMARFEFEHQAELRFREKLSQVLTTKRQDQIHRICRWRQQQAQEQKDWDSHYGRGAQGDFGRRSSKRRRLR